MTAFQYEALDAQGRRKKGVLSADTARLARTELTKSGLSPLSLEAVAGEQQKRSGGARKISSGDLVPLTRQLAVLIASSAPVEEALQAVAMQMEKPIISRTLLAVRARVMEGWRLSEALAEHPKSFSPLYRGIISAGEQSGNLGAVLTRLALMQEKSQSLQMKAITALIYPAVLVFIAIAVTSGLMVFVVPKIVEQFDMLGAKLPFVTQLVIAISAFLSQWGLLLLGIILLSGLGFWQAMRQPNLRRRIDGFILKLPIIGKLMRGLDAARFARTLSTLVASGAPLLDGLRAARRTLVNTDIGARIDKAVTAVQEGAALSGALRRSEAFAPMMVHMVAAGERAGELPLMLEKTADHLEADFDTASSLAIRLLEPVIIVAMGGVVLTIMLAILMPILQMNTLAAG